VARETVMSVLDAARWAPSWVNTQPWSVAVVSGEVKDRLSDAVIEARLSGAPANPDFSFRPTEWGEPFISRRRACRSTLFSIIGVRSQDKVTRLKTCMNSYRFFGAPMGLLFFMDRGLGVSSLLDMGTFMQNTMLVAMDHGLATCALASLAEYPDVARAVLEIPPSRALVCGMAIGYPDPEAEINNVRMERAPADSFTTWFE